MPTIAIIGSGPAGYYTAEAAAKKWGDSAKIDIFDSMPVPYGLIRTGVAPDHQSIKGVSRRYEKTALTDMVRFVGNITIGSDIGIDELETMYDAVVLATGAPEDKTLSVEGADLANVFGSAAFVGWYNGHPKFADLDVDLSGKHAVVIGIGNVALDVARILSKTEEEFGGSDVVAHALNALMQSNLNRITILGRRGPHQIQMTPKELGELGELKRAQPLVSQADLPSFETDANLEPGLRKSVALLRRFAAEPASGKPIAIDFDMFASPLRFNGADRVESVTIEETRLDGERAVATGHTYDIPADIVVTCIGYRTSRIPGVPYDEQLGRFANDDGRIRDGLYCVGWARRGPTGTIGTNRPDGFALIDLIEADLAILPAGKPGRPAFDSFAKEHDLDIVTFRDWQKIEQAEISAAREGSPREKFVRIEEMIEARDG